jgi:ABC-type dipeptide/oligopeptide/nickel transport system permease subunit
MGKLAGFAGKNKAAAASAVFLAAVALAAILAPCIAPFDPAAQDLAAARQAPSARHWLGTDFQGSDVLSKIIYGARPTMAVAFGVSVCTVAIGFAAGVAAGYRGGRVDAALMRTVDVMLAFPALLLNIILVAVLGAGFTSLFLALTISGWPGVARITRGLVLSLSNSQYVSSARALGATGPRIVLRHIMPNCASTVIVVFAMRAGSTVLAAAGLNYLGLGAPSDTNSWGTMVNLGQYDIVTAWWWPLAPATAIALTVLSMNLAADAARDYFDPRMAGNLV